MPFMYLYDCCYCTVISVEEDTGYKASVESRVGRAEDCVEMGADPVNVMFV